MNFYPFHIGDYASATAHLSVLEDGIYRRLLDCYYTREAPIPADIRQACRLVRAQSKEERQAVEDVLREFFSETPEGWRHARCDEEIATAREKGEESEARKANERERQKRHRERRSALFALLRNHGQVPAFDTPTETLQRMADAIGRNGDSDSASRDDNASRHGDGDAPVTRTETQTQRLTNPNPNPNPNPKVKKQPQGAGAPPFVLPDWVTADDWQAFEAMRKQLRKPLTPRAKELVIRELDRLRGQGHAPSAVLQQSIRKGWQDVYPVKADQLALAPPGAGPSWRGNAL